MGVVSWSRRSLSSGKDELGESKLVQKTNSGCGSSGDDGVESAGEEEYETGFVSYPLKFIKIKFNFELSPSNFKCSK